MSLKYEEIDKLYREAAQVPDVGLCCTTTPLWQFPGLDVPGIMKEMNYGCGSTVNPKDLVDDPTILYVGVGGGMELLQFSYFSRKKSGVIGVDVLPEMLEASEKNIDIALKTNDWLEKEFIDLRLGNALDLNVEDESIDVVGQNCVFNMFELEDMKKALQEAYRVLKPHGKLVMSDPICDQKMPESLLGNDRLRAECLSGAIPLKDYVDMITSVGFGTVEIRARRPYRVLSPNQYDTNENIFIESIEVCAIKDPMPEDGPCVFTGRTAIYYGDDEFYDDEKGHVLLNNQPLAICDKTAGALAELNNEHILLTKSTFPL